MCPSFEVFQRLDGNVERFRCFSSGRSRFRLYSFAHHSFNRTRIILGNSERFFTVAAIVLIIEVFVVFFLVDAVTIWCILTTGSSFVARIIFTDDGSSSELCSSCWTSLFFFVDCESGEARRLRFVCTDASSESESTEKGTPRPSPRRRLVGHLLSTIAFHRELEGGGEVGT